MDLTFAACHLLVLLSLTLGQASDTRQGCGLLGPVKSVRIETSAAQVNRPRTTTESNIASAQLDSYDRSGRLTESVYYNSDLSVSWVWTITYDSDGRKIEERACETGALSCTHALYTYSQNGRRGDVSEIGEDGSVTGWSVNAYDSKGLELSVSRYNRDGQRVYRSVCSYDQTGKNEKRLEVSYLAPSHAPRRQVYSYDSDGRVAEERSYESTYGGALRSRLQYNYDARGNLMEELIYWNQDTLAKQITYSYEFDSLGNWIKRIELRETVTDGRTSVQSYTSTKRDINYY